MAVFPKYRQILPHDPAFLNLSDNALKFTRNRTVAQIEIGSPPAEGRTVYCVRDNGIGFDMQ